MSELVYRSSSPMPSLSKHSLRTQALAWLKLTLCLLSNGFFAFSKGKSLVDVDGVVSELDDVSVDREFL